MVSLKKHIKDNSFENIYLIYGEEEFLKRYYIDKMKEKIVPIGSEIMNLDIIENSDKEATGIIDMSETLPFMADKRLIIVKKSNFFVSGKNEDSTILSDYLGKFPNTTIVIFMEDKVDKRNKLYKAIKKYGCIAEINHPSETELVRWLINKFKKSDKILERNTGMYMVQTIGNDMDTLSVEVEKLVDYKGKEKNITKEDVDAISIKSVEVKIFDMIDCMGMKLNKRALEIFHGLIKSNESPIMILFMVTRQFRLLFQAKLLIKDGYNQNMISKKLGIPYFVANKCMSQSSRYSLEILEKALNECLKTDINIKTGKIKGDIGVEILILSFSK